MQSELPAYVAASPVRRVRHEHTHTHTHKRAASNPNKKEMM